MEVLGCGSVIWETGIFFEENLHDLADPLMNYLANFLLLNGGGTTHKQKKHIWLDSEHSSNLSLFIHFIPVAIYHEFDHNLSQILMWFDQMEESLKTYKPYKFISHSWWHLIV